MKVLLADRDGGLRRELTALLGSWGHDLFEAADPQAALEAVRTCHPRLVLTELFADDHRSGIENAARLVELIKLDYPRVFVVLMARPGEERPAMEALRAGAVNFLGRPADTAELRMVLDKYGTLSVVQDEEQMVPGMVARARVELVVPTELRFAPRVSDYLLRDILVGYADADATALSLGMQEMIQNAMEHGNLGITYEEKSQALEAGRFAELVQQRCDDPRYAGRMVHIALERNRHGFECRIRDEGNGFDWRCLPDPLTPDGILQMHGRGIYLTRFSYDRVEYNTTGTEVVIAKALNPLADVPLSREPSSDLR